MRWLSLVSLLMYCFLIDGGLLMSLRSCSMFVVCCGLCVVCIVYCLLVGGCSLCVVCRLSSCVRCVACWLLFVDVWVPVFWS